MRCIAGLTISEQAQHRQIPRQTGHPPKDARHVRLLLCQAKDRIDLVRE